MISRIVCVLRKTEEFRVIIMADGVPWSEGIHKVLAGDFQETNFLIFVSLL